MLPSRPSVRPLLAVQAWSLLTLSVLSIAWVWRAWSAQPAIVQAPRAAIEQSRAAATEAMLSPYHFAVTRDAAHAARTRDAVAEAGAALKVIRPLVPGARAPVDAALQALADLEAATGRVYAAAPGTDITGVWKEVDLARGKLVTAIANVENTVEARIQVAAEEAVAGLLAIWAGMAIVQLSVNSLARRRAQSNEEHEARTVRGVVVDIGGALRQAASGAPAPPISRPEPGSAFEPLADASRDIIVALDALRAANARMRKSTSFTQDLIEALANAETQGEVLDTTVRAGRVAYPDARFQVLLIDPATNDVQAHDDRDPAACTLTCADQCPAVKRGRTLHHGGAGGISRCARLKAPDVRVTCAPVMTDGRFAAVSQLAGYAPDAVQFEDLEALGLALGARLGVVRSLEAKSREASTDALTGLANRRKLQEHLARLDPTETPFCVVAADLDHFKALNDAYGHEEGDRCLRIFARVLEDASRGSDLACRVGGEEFLVLLPGVGLRAGLAVSMRVRTLLADALADDPIQFTVSLGVAARPDHGGTSDAVIRAADAALYEAKENGRDQVVPARGGALLGAAR